MAQALGDRAQKRIRAWCKKTGHEMSSQVYPKGFFLASASIGPDTRSWRVARWDAKATKVLFVNESPYALKTQADAALSWEMASHGLSPSTKPVSYVQGAPMFPRYGL
jgi:hypothetical protein